MVRKVISIRPIGENPCPPRRHQRGGREGGKRGGEVCTINQIVTQLYIRRLLSAGRECNFLIFYFDLWKAERLTFHPYLIPLLFCLYNLLIHFMKTDPVFCTPMDWIKTFTTPLLLNHLVLPI